MESTACQVEHILNTEVTEAVCAFLGHPPSCPHGRAIPSGHCCEQATATIEPLIVPLARLPPGGGGGGGGGGGRHASLRRLGAMGLVPGRRLRLRQSRPALVVQVGETELALDAHAGREILVRRHGG